MKINLKGLNLKASVGIYEHEKTALTKVIISAEIHLKTEGFEESKILDYDIVMTAIENVVASRHYGYIEDLAYCLQKEVQKLSGEIEKVNIKVRKCILGNILDEISVEV